MFCLQCSKPIFHQSLCEECWNILRQTKKRNIREVDSFPVFTFWSWPMNHPLKALWLQKLKGQEDEKIWFDVVELLLEDSSPQKLPMDIGTLWIPLPTSKTKNHALGLAKALQYFYGGTLWDGLKVQTETEQKEKTKAERQKRVIFPLGKPPCTSFKTVCFIDDIITTGSTFRGALMALGYPENGLGIALMDRPLKK